MIDKAAAWLAWRGGPAAMAGWRFDMATLNATVDLLPTAHAPGAARRTLRELLRTWRAPQSLADAELLVTELVTNAVEHAGGEASLLLQLSLSDGWLRVSLADGSSVHPVLRELDGRAPRGRGVLLIATIADRWGSEDYQGGKRVWFELGPAEPKKHVTRR